MWICLFVFGATAPQWGHGLPQAAGLLWTSDQLVAETST